MTDLAVEANRHASIVPFTHLGLVLPALISNPLKAFELPNLCERVRYTKQQKRLGADVQASVASRQKVHYARFSSKFV